MPSYSLCNPSEEKFRTTGRQEDSNVSGQEYKRAASQADGKRTLEEMWTRGLKNKRIEKQGNRTSSRGQEATKIRRQEDRKIGRQKDRKTE